MVDGGGLETVGIVYAAADNRTARRGVNDGEQETTTPSTRIREL